MQARLDRIKHPLPPASSLPLKATRSTAAEALTPGESAAIINGESHLHLFQRGLQKEILARLHGRLAPYDALVLGSHESLPGNELFAPWPQGVKIFRKCDCLPADGARDEEKIPMESRKNIMSMEGIMTGEQHPDGLRNYSCESLENHEKHICQLITKVTAGEIVDLVDLPGFICENCARAANKAEYLCRPRSLEDNAD